MKLIDIPEDVMASMKIPRNELETVLKRELAIALYEREVLPLGKAREIAAMSKWEFLEVLGRRKIPRHYTEKEMAEDVIFAK